VGGRPDVRSGNPVMTNELACKSFSLRGMKVGKMSGHRRNRCDKVRCSCDGLKKIKMSRSKSMSTRIKCDRKES
jgi:hypothetical protein